MSINSAHRTSTMSVVLAAMFLYVIWVAVTWLLEGRIDTLRRPDAVFDRLAYALIANLLIGIVGATVVLRLAITRSAIHKSASGFTSGSRTLLAVVAGLAFGLGFYLLFGGQTVDAVILTNAFAQVLVVSAAEVLVCWSVLGSLTESATQRFGRPMAVVVAMLTSSILFGLYHFAHSPPFNTADMVAFLSGIGLMTSLFFFVSRSVYGTIVFHNFLGVLGVTNALAATGRLESLSTLQFPLLITAATTVIVMVLTDMFLIHRPQTQ